MKGKKKNFWWKKLASWLLVLTLALSFCTGCNRSITPVVPVEDGTDAPDVQWMDLQTGAEIDTLNVVLVIDTSRSTLQNDPNRNYLEAACMFLNTLYASASQRESRRLPGSKSANVGVILYNDTVDQFSEKLLSLASKSTVDVLKDFVRSAEPKAKGGDSALAEALDKAVRLLYDQSDGQEKLSERSVVLLFTDGYASNGRANTLSARESLAQSSGFADAPGTDESFSGSGGEADGEDYARYAAYGAVAMPDFGDAHQAQLETALKRAKDQNYEIFVLMLNPDNRDDGSWEQFKGISDYTKRNFMEKLMPIFISLGTDLRFEGMPGLNDFIFPEDYSMLSPAFLNDPMFGGGIFLDPDGGDNKVNYLMATSPTQMMTFYTTLAANMLAGSSAAECNPTIERIDHDGILEENYCYGVEVPNSGVSALLCFCFSNDGISGVTLEGPNNSEGQIDYTRILRRQDSEGWANEGTMRNDWYLHKTPSGEDQFNIVALTIIDPTPGLWNIYVRGKDGINRPLHTYATLVSGAKVNLAFLQGNDPPDGDHPVTGGDFAVQVDDYDGEPLSEEFYKTLKAQCSVFRIPPWVPISGEDDIRALMENPSAWLEQTLRDYKTPQKWLDEMSAGKISFHLDEDDEGNPALKGHFDAPLPGLYYGTLNMTSGERSSQIDYSKSFWVRYEAKTDRQIIINKVNRNVDFHPPYLPDAWGKTSNTPAAQELVLNMDEKSLKITPTGFATVQFNTKDPQSLVIHSMQSGKGTLSFDVTTEYGDKWTLEYDIIVNG